MTNITYRAWLVSSKNRNLGVSVKSAGLGPHKEKNMKPDSSELVEITWEYPHSSGEECTSAFIENLKTGEEYYYSIAESDDGEEKQK